MTQPDWRKPKTGDVFSIEYPMDLVEVELFDDSSDGSGGPYTAMRWRPIRTNNATWVGVAYYEDDETVLCDGVGRQILEVIDIHKPGGYPARVFYVQQWQSPDGHTFGQKKLRILTLDAFRRRARGFKYRFTVEQGKAA